MVKPTYISMCTQLIYCTHITNAATFVMKTNTPALDLLYFKFYCNYLTARNEPKIRKSVKYKKCTKYVIFLNFVILNREASLIIDKQTICLAA